MNIISPRSAFRVPRLQESGLIWLVLFVAVAVAVIVVGGIIVAGKASKIRVRTDPEWTNNAPILLTLTNEWVVDPKDLPPGARVVELPELKFRLLVNSTSPPPIVDIQSSTNMVDWVDEDMNSDDVFYLMSDPAAMTNAARFFRGVIRR